MGYFWQVAQGIDMTLDMQGNLVGFTWEGDYHPIRRILGHWREDTGWWLWRTWRDYYQVATRTGMAVELFEDLTTHTWHLLRIYD